MFMFIFACVAFVSVLIIVTVRMYDMAVYFRICKKYKNKVKLKKASYRRELSHLGMTLCWTLICFSRYLDYIDSYLAKANMLLGAAFAILFSLDVLYLLFVRYSYLTYDGIIRSENVVLPGSKIFLNKQRFVCISENSELDIYIGKSNTPAKYVIVDNSMAEDVLNYYENNPYLNDNSISL